MSRLIDCGAIFLASAADNGKFLGVSQGTVSWITPPGSGLPETTVSDNNAMMQVINGAWAKGKKVWVGTAADYTALNSYDNDTLYFITTVTSP